MRAVAPNLDFRLWRPILAPEPLYTVRDLPFVTLRDVLDAHEALDLRRAMHEKAAAASKGSK